jgi:predicted amidophosphoribosyltransferase
MATWKFKKIMERTPGAKNYICSNCGNESASTTPFCPMCGKPMTVEGYEEVNKALEDDCKKFLGMGEYKSPSNTVLADPHFKKSMEEKYGKNAVAEMLNRLWREMTIQ